MKRLIGQNDFITSKYLFCFFICLFTFYSFSVQAASTTVTYQVSSDNDDAEERGAGVPGSAGTMSRNSTDMELVYDGGTRQVVGVRFSGVAIKQGATSITNAYVQFTVDENDSGTTNVVIYGEDEDDTSVFGTANGDITGRTQTSASVLWSSIPTWNGAGTAGTDQRTPDISSIISEIVQRPGWSENNSIVIMFEPGTGCNSSACQRTAESYDGTPAQAPQLVITLDDSDVATTLNYPVTQSSDDAEEQGAGVPGSAGTMESLSSTDLEINYEGGNRQVVGIRFQNIAIKQGATSITDAYIQYTVDETDSGITNVVIYGEDGDDTVTFGTTNGDITGRTKTSASVLWTGVVAWNSVGDAGTDQRTPNISSIISEIVQRPGWNSFNSIVFIIEPGTGCNSSACQRTAESFDGTAPPRLVITLDPSDVSNVIVSTLNNSTLGGQAIDQDEAVEYDGVTGNLFFDEATFSNNAHLYGIHAIDDGTGNLLIASRDDETVDGVSITPDDIAQVSPTATAGVYDSTVIVFDGGTHFAAVDEAIDAVYKRKSNGNIILSTRRGARLPRCSGGNLNFSDDDLVEWDLTNTCAEFFLDTSAAAGGDLIPNATGDEDINGVHLLDDDPNLILFTLVRNNTIRGTAVLDGDIILYNVSANTASVFFSESEFSSGDEDVSAITFSVAVSTAPTIDHYAISYPLGTPGVTCEAQAVRITAHGDAADHTNIVAPSNTTQITLSTSPAADGWTLKSGNSTFTPPDKYTFDGTETFAEFWLTETTATTAPHIDIDVTDGTATDDDGDATEDANIEFSDAVFRFFAGGVGESIGLQIAGKESDIAPGNQTIQLRSVVTNTSTMACESRILNTTTIEMAYKCNNPTTCQGAPRLQIENAAAATFDITPGNANASTVDASNGSFDNVDLDFGATGAATLSFDFDDVGQVQLFARETLAAVSPDPAYTIFGTSNMFIVRPFGFDIDSGGLRAADWLDNSALDDSTNTNLSYAADAGGSVFATAGNVTNTFSVTLRGVVWESADDDGAPSGTANDGIADTGANLTNNSITPNFGQETSNSELVDVTSGNVQPTNVGSLFFGSDLDFINGTITTNLAFDEVGIVDLTAALDTGDYLSGGSDVTTTHQRFGRFKPDRFTLADNTPTLENSCVAGSFTYMDESFYYGSGNEPAITVTAVNEAGGTTVNYGDGGTTATDFWKLPTALARTYDDNNVNNGSTFTDLAAASVNVSGDDNFDGVGIFTLVNTVLDRDSFLFDRDSVDLNASEGAPFTAGIDLLIRVTAGSLSDTDGVCYDGDGDGTCETDGSDDYTALTDTGGTALSLNQLRFGRFNIGTAVGSELLTLSPLLITEHFNGTGFVLNTNDTCTALDLTDHVRLENTGTAVVGNSTMTIGGGTTSISTFNNPLSSGDTGTVFSVPGAGNTGFVNIIGNLGCNDVTVACVGTVTFDHLRYDWDDDDDNDDGPYDDEPTGRIDFGLFEGPSNYIYIREPW